MGNKPSTTDRRHSFDANLNIDSGDKAQTKKKNKKNTKNSSKKTNPIEDQSENESNTVDLKIYRSASMSEEVRRRSTGDTLKSDIRIYRRSMADSGVDSPTGQLSRGTATTRTLPRNFGGESMLTRSKPDDNSGTRRRDSSRSSTGGWRLTPDDAVSFEFKSVVRPSSRTSSNSGVTASTVTADDFPDTACIVRRLQQFEVRFVDRFTALYSALPDTVQLSALSIAIHRESVIDRYAHPSSAATVSLWNYLRSTSQHYDLPADLPLDQFCPTISAELYERVIDLRREIAGQGADCANVIHQLVRDIVRSVAAEAAAAVSTAFEYQISLVGDGLPCQLLADRAADCAVEFLKKTNRHLDVNAVVTGVVNGRPSDCHRFATVSVFVGGQRELKWNVDEILHRAGLRKDRMLVSDGIDSVAGHVMPWRFYASSSSEEVDPMTYGYRGQLLHRDFTAETSTSGQASNQILYRIDHDEESKYDLEVSWRLDDFHRVYRPFRRFVGVEAIEAYSSRAAESSPSLSLGEFVQSVHGDAWRRDEVEPIYRPIVNAPSRRQPPIQTEVRPRCVSDAVEFSRQHGSRQTWSPATAATHRIQTSRDLGHRPSPLVLADQTNGSGMSSPLSVNDVIRHGFNTAPVNGGEPMIKPKVFSNTLTTKIVFQEDGVNEHANVTRNRMSAPSTSFRRSIASPSSKYVEDELTSNLSSPSNTAPVTGGFPTIEELFAKELRALKAKTIHVTDFPVFEEEPVKQSPPEERSRDLASAVVNGRTTSEDNERTRTSNSSTVEISFVPAQHSNGRHSMTSLPISGDKYPSNGTSNRDSNFVVQQQSPMGAVNDKDVYLSNSKCSVPDGGNMKRLIISNI